jgi:hypothetical protein
MSRERQEEKEFSINSFSLLSLLIGKTGSALYCSLHCNSEDQRFLILSVGEILSPLSDHLTYLTATCGQLIALFDSILSVFCPRISSVCLDAIKS